MEHLLAKAMEIADREGPDGMTMRRLASELGIGVMTVYGHVRTKEELLDAVVDMAVAELAIPDQGPWDEQLVELFTNLRELLHRHPTVLHADPLRSMTGPASLHAADAALGLLREGGLDGVDAIDGMSALINYTFGAAMFRLGRNGEERRLYERNVRGSDPDELPNVAALAQHFLERGSEREFEVGLRILIDGLARISARPHEALTRPPRTAGEP
jgi:AcrR family transcriptional regulator